MKLDPYFFVNSFEFYGKSINGIIAFLILSSINNKRKEERKGIQHETFIFFF